MKYLDRKENYDYENKLEALSAVFRFFSLEIN